MFFHILKIILLCQHQRKHISFLFPFVIPAGCWAGPLSPSAASQGLVNSHLVFEGCSILMVSPLQGRKAWNSLSQTPLPRQYGHVNRFHQLGVPVWHSFRKKWWCNQTKQSVGCLLQQKPNSWGRYSGAMWPGRVVDSCLKAHLSFLLKPQLLIRVGRGRLSPVHSSF